MQTKTVRSRGGKFFNWMAAVILSLMLISLVSPAPSFALDLSGSGALDWSSLSMTGIDFTLSNFVQVRTAEVFSSDGSFAGGSTSSNDWGTSGIAVALPSVGSATSGASATELSGSVSLFSDRTFGGGAVGRFVAITAMNPGVLTVSIPYLLEDHGQISGDASLYTAASLQFSNCRVCPTPQSDGHALNHIFADNSLHKFSETETGTLSISIPFTQGQTGFLNFDTRAIGSVPGPGTIWPLAIGLVLVIFLHRWRAGRTEKGMRASQGDVL